MIRVNVYLDIDSFILLDKVDYEDVWVSLIPTKYEKISISVPLVVMKSIDEKNEIALISKYKMNRYFEKDVKEVME